MLEKIKKFRDTSIYIKIISEVIFKNHHPNTKNRELNLFSR